MMAVLIAVHAGRYRLPIREDQDLQLQGQQSVRCRSMQECVCCVCAWMGVGEWIGGRWAAAHAVPTTKSAMCVPKY
jgi:hypothetical protein